MNSLETEIYKMSADGVNVDEYIDNFLLGGHKHLLKRGDNLDFSKERKLVKIVSFFFLKFSRVFF